MRLTHSVSKDIYGPTGAGEMATPTMTAAEEPGEFVEPIVGKPVVATGTIAEAADLVRQAVEHLRTASETLQSAADSLRTVDRSQVSDLEAVLNVAADVQGEAEDTQTSADSLEQDVLEKVNGLAAAQVPEGLGPEQEGALAP